MQFVNHGPDVPDALLQAHEDGKVVFFCGAGIAYPAGLPDFKGLVNRIYEHLGDVRSPIEDAAYQRGQFDATLDILEHRIAGQRIAVRKALTKGLNPNLRKKGASDTHTALLQLARSRKGSLRLVTTNFDRIFEYVVKRDKLVHASYAAPMLPIPKNSRWDGIAYLHGLLPAKPDESSLHRLVVTSGDFGLAYLTERWAARFVSELFRNYIVCFVGYSINDPILRYMMDALAADKLLGEITPQAYAFGDCAPGEEGAKINEWEAKGVVPILYQVPTGTYNHSALHRTLKAWAETYRDGVLGKERIVLDYALAHPSASTQQDDFIGRMLWAVSHETGSPAKAFAEHNPVPSLDWLKVFSDDRYRHADLIRFGVAPDATADHELRFSLNQRPAPYRLSTRMALVAGHVPGPNWDPVMFHIANWLVRHLNDPKLIFWVIEQGHKLHESLCNLIEHRLDHLAQLERESKQAELDAIRANAPNALPGKSIRLIWRLLLTGRVKSDRSRTDLYRWLDRLKRDGLTMTLRLELRHLLAPKISLRKPYSWTDDAPVEFNLDRLNSFVKWELELTSDYVYSTLLDKTDEQWAEALPTLFDDFQLLLHDALGLLSELGEIGDRSDHSYWSLPSITPHWQNRRFNEWTALIELVREAWLAIRDADAPRATRIAQTWFTSPYPTFKRLALFAASHEGCVGSDEWVDWLLSDEHLWLWTVETQRECMRLIVLQGRNLSPAAQEKLEAGILAGLPRTLFKDDFDPVRFQEVSEHSIWLHLAKLRESGAILSPNAESRLRTMEAQHPDWTLSAHGKDEFPSWMSGTGDPDFGEDRHIDIAPRSRRELTSWLTQQPAGRLPFDEDTWRDVCQTRFYHSVAALCDLAKQGTWPATRWQQALQVWSEEKYTTRSWRFVSELVREMPPETLESIVHAVTWWIDTCSKTLKLDDQTLIDLVQRILALPLEADTGITENGKPIKEPITEAINHPIGHVTQALLNHWLSTQPNDNDGIPAAIRDVFTQLCNVGVARYRHARVLLSANLIALFRVDRAWTEANLFPLLDWERDANMARVVWEGFFWSPRLYMPLLAALKRDLLCTARHFDELSKHGRQYATFLTYAALNNAEDYSYSDFRDAIAALPQEGLERVSQALYRALEGAGEQREDYWKNRIHPFWQHVWPKSLDKASENIADNLVRMSIAAGDEFSSAFETVSPWLQHLSHPDHMVHLLNESGICRRHPDAALRLLDATIGNQRWGPRELGNCLDTIKEAAPKLERDARFMRVFEYYRTHCL